MSVGITSGPIQFFLVGSVHRELLVAGPTATEVLEMEGIADAGEIALTPSLAASLDPSCSGTRKEEAILLAGPPEVPRQRAPDVGDVSAIDIAECIPIAARSHVLLDHSEPEHRTITAAFIDLLGTDDLLATVGADALAADLDERLRTIQEAALRFEVPFYETDVGRGSVKALLTAGAPSSTGRDEERMLRALREILDTPGKIPVRVGVNTGRVFAGDFGPPYRRAYRVFGDAVNTAARIMSRAEPGQILASEVVIERSRTRFEATPIEPFAAKGKALPIHASIVGPVLGLRKRRDASSFAGRDLELQALRRVVDAAEGGEAWTIELSGAPGLGKSQLVDELLSRSPRLEVFRAQCDEYQASTPYFPLRAALRDILGVSQEASTAVLESTLHRTAASRLPLLLPWLPLLAVPFGLELEATPESKRLDERFVPERIADLLSEFLAEMLRERTAMLLVEDAQFIDEATGELLRQLERRTRQDARTWILLVSQREPTPLATTGDELADEARLAICLLPLTFAQSCALVDLVTDEEPLPPHVVEGVAERAQGNVLFLLALLDHVRETRSLDALPESIEAHITAEIDRLAPLDRDLLRYASVLGTSFDPRLVAAALRDERAVDTAAWKRLGELIEPDGHSGLRFRNVLLRDTAYEGLPYRRRRQLHAWLADAIEEKAGEGAEDEAAVLALHFYEAEKWHRAWFYARRAAERASEMYANTEAAAALGRAIAAGRRRRDLPAEELAAAYEALGDVRFRLGEFDLAAGAFRASRRLVGPESLRSGELALKEAQIPMRFGNYPVALRQLSRALRRLEPHRGRAAAASRARLCSRYGAVRMRQNRTRDAISWFDRAEREARTGKARDVLAYAYTVHDLALLAEGRPGEATHGAAALAIFEELGDLVWQAATLNNTGLVAYELGNWTESVALYDRAAAIWKTTGDRWSATFAQYNRGEILSDQGRFDEAETELREALRVWRASGALPEIAQVTRQLGRLAARRGDDLTARTLLQAARDQQLRNGESSEALWTEAWLAEADLLGGDAISALEQASGLLDRVERSDGGTRILPLLRRVRAWALLTLGRVDDAADELERGVDAARSGSAGFEAAALLEGRAMVARARTGGDPELESELRAKLEGLGITVSPADRLQLGA
jgi:class 3 adenylate cyclase/tetratricopeptide (TPR) repeat protein